MFTLDSFNNFVGKLRISSAKKIDLISKRCSFTHVSQLTEHLESLNVEYDPRLIAILEHSNFDIEEMMVTRRRRKLDESTDDEGGVDEESEEKSEEEEEGETKFRRRKKGKKRGWNHEMNLEEAEDEEEDESPDNSDYFSPSSPPPESSAKPSRKKKRKDSVTNSLMKATDEAKKLHDLQLSEVSGVNSALSFRLKKVKNKKPKKHPALNRNVFRNIFEPIPGKTGNFRCLVCTLPGVNWEKFAIVTGASCKQGLSVASNNLERHAGYHVGHFFTPEFLARLDNSVLLKPVVENELKVFCLRLKEKIEKYDKAKQVRLDVWLKKKEDTDELSMLPSSSAPPRRRWFGRAQLYGVRRLTETSGRMEAYIKWMVLVDRIMSNTSLRCATGQRALPICLVIAAASQTSLTPNSHGACSANGLVQGDDDLVQYAVDLVPTEHELHHMLLPGLKFYILKSLCHRLQQVDVFNITSDGWTAEHQAGKPHYSSIVLHYISQDWNLHVVPLGAFHMRAASMSSETIKRFLMESMGSEILPSDATLNCITSDSASSQARANEEMLGADADHVVFCFQHTLRLAMKTAVEFVPQVAGQHALCVKIAGIFSRNSEMADFLKKLQRSRSVGISEGDEGKPLALPQWRKFRSAVCTRFDTYIESMAAVHENYSLLEEMGNSRFFDGFDVNIEQLNEVLIAGALEPLKALGEFLDKIGNEQVIVISLIPQLIGIFWRATAAFFTEPEEIVGTAAHSIMLFKEKLRREIRERFVLPYLTRPGPVLFASMLDPRVGRGRLASLIQELLPENDPDAINISNVLDRCETRLAEHALALAGGGTSISLELTSALLKIELVRVNEACLPMDADILQWWRSSSQTSSSPLILKLVRGYLSCPAASTSSERLFSAAGLICRPLRARLSPDTVEDLLVIYKNIDLVSLMTPNQFYLMLQDPSLQ